MNFPFPPLDLLLSDSENDQLNINVTSASAVFDLSAPHTGSANAPSSEVDLDVDSYRQQLAFMDGPAALNPPTNQPGALLDMLELHETIEDYAQEAGIPILSEQQPSSLEGIAAFVNASLQDVTRLLDHIFYTNLDTQILRQFPQFADPLMQRGMPPP